MNNKTVVSGLEPQAVFGIFSDICAIPHGSGNTEAVRAYCREFAENLGYENICDDCGNILIRVPASAGRENDAPVMLQGHLDMVCEKESGNTTDFTKDGLKLLVDGDFLTADGTTLGGDDGIAVAMILALISDKAASHPALEVLFTTDEETGMNGAVGFDCSLLKSKTLINLDSENESMVWVACAGGMRANIDFSITRTECSTENTADITLTGLAGGHSGAEIDKGRINAIKALAAFLKQYGDGSGLELISFNGGLMDNAIPREASARVAVKDFKAFKADADGYIEKLLKGATEADKNAVIICNNHGGSVCSVFCEEHKNAVLGFLTEAPNGIIAMSNDIEGLVQTSLNIGITKTAAEGFHASFSLRSSVNSEKAELSKNLKAAAEKYCAAYSTYGEYPAWEYNEISPLRDLYASVYEELNGRKCGIEAIHAGLECGIFYDKIENLDCISVGPDMHDIHTPQERLSIKSVKAVYETVREVLKRI